MTVAGLIEMLRRYDGEMPVFVVREHDLVELDMAVEAIGSCDGEDCPVVILG